MGDQNAIKNETYHKRGGSPRGNFSIKKISKILFFCINFSEEEFVEEFVQIKISSLFYSSLFLLNDFRINKIIFKFSIAQSFFHSYMV